MLPTLAGLPYSDAPCGNSDAADDNRVPGVVFCEDGGEYGGGGEGMPAEHGQHTTHVVLSQGPLLHGKID